MCGIFTIIYNDDYITHDTIKQCFTLGQSRGPEMSHLEIINGVDKSITSHYSPPTKTNVYYGFHRLAINGLNQESDQPLHFEHISLICNGEIYNFRELFRSMGVLPHTQSDCEVIIHLYLRYGIRQTLQMLDGVFAFALYDHKNKTMVIARDPYGVRPLYQIQYTSNTYDKYMYGYASELKMLTGLVVTPDKNDVNTDTINALKTIKQVPPGTYSVLKTNIIGKWFINEQNLVFHRQPFSTLVCQNEVQQSSLMNYLIDETSTLSTMRSYLENAVKKRVCTTERPIACLLSGGLDSSLICALVAKEVRETQGKQIETYCIGLEGSDDLKYAREVASHLNTLHYEIVVTEKDFLSAIPEVIRKIESYDTTTVRASVGNYLVSKYISENSSAKVIFNGDGADELMGGYLYFHKAEDPIEFDKECRRLLSHIHFFDVLRSDKSIASCGLEARTPFLDREWVQYYLSLAPNIRCHKVNNVCEKYLIRKAYDNTDILPKNILWRTKEAFSDGVSKHSRSWYEIIQEHIGFFVESNIDKDKQETQSRIMYGNIPIVFDTSNNFQCNKPTTNEQCWYRSIFEHFYPHCGHVVPYFWMPKYVDVSDSSARVLDIYSQVQGQQTQNSEKSNIQTASQQRPNMIREDNTVFRERNATI